MTTPGSTRAVRDAGSRSRIRFMWREVSKTIPGPMLLPATEVPAPRIVTGMPARRAASRPARRSSTSSGKATACGSTR